MEKGDTALILDQGINGVGVVDFSKTTTGQLSTQRAGRRGPVEGKGSKGHRRDEELHGQKVLFLGIGA